MLFCILFYQTFQLSIAAAALCSAFSAGASLGYPGVLLYQLSRKDSEFPINLDNSSWMGSLHGLAGVLGVIAPLVVQWKGRKFTFIAGCFIMSIGWVLTYFANGISMILWSEFVLGFGTSVIMTVSYDAITEMITPAYRTIVGQSHCAFNVLGIAVAGVMTRFLHWRLISLILCLPSVMGILISFTWLESPLWLAYKEDIEKCKTNFTKLRGTDEHSIRELQKVMVAYNEEVSRNKILKKYSYAKRLWRQLSSKDFIMPSLHGLLLFNHIYWSGATVVLIYSLQLISKATQNDKAAFIGGIIINFAFVISIAISNILVRFFKNKTVLLLSTTGASVCLISTSLVSYLQNVGFLQEDSLLSVYFMFGYIVSTSLGQVPVALTMSAEIIPVKHRGLAGVLYIVCGSLINASSLKVSPYLFVYIGLWGTFFIYALNCTVCGLLIWKYVPETKGKTLQEIENYYTCGSYEIRLLSKDEIEPIDVSLK